MIFRKRKDVDPNNIYINIVDDLGSNLSIIKGNRISSNSNLDEFIFFFFSRVEEAMKFKRLQNDLKVTCNDSQCIPAILLQPSNNI
jgi:hypothetical protein